MGTDVARPEKGSRFKSTLDGVPVILEIDEVVVVDASKGEAVLKTHVSAPTKRKWRRKPPEPAYLSRPTPTSLAEAKEIVRAGDANPRCGV